MNGVFTLITPVLQVGSTFITHEELFDGEDLKVETLKKLIGEKKEGGGKEEV